MSNSTYCEDHYEQPDWMKEIQGLEKQNKELRELLVKKEKESIDKEKIRKEVESLTWEDIRDILDLYDEVTSMDYCSDIYGEVLKRFKENKGKNYDNCKDKER